MDSKDFYHRKVSKKVENLIKENSVLILEGARRIGKSTLCRYLLEEKAAKSYVDFLDFAEFERFNIDPKLFVQQSKFPMIIDEAQRLGDISSKVKHFIDVDPKKKFVLTGSLPLDRTSLGGSNPLVGRSVTIRLYGITEVEKQELNINPIESILSLFANETSDKKSTSAKTNKLSNIKTKALEHEELFKIMQEGNMPIPKNSKQQVLSKKFYSDFVRYVCESYETKTKSTNIFMQRLVELLAKQSGNIVNVHSVQQQLERPYNSVKELFSNVEDLFLFNRLNNFMKKKDFTVNGSKFHIDDVALALWASNIDKLDKLYKNTEKLGHFVESLVVNNFIAQLSWLEDEFSTYFLREKVNNIENEIDFVVESKNARFGFEIKLNADVSYDDYKQLDYFYNKKKIDFGVVVCNCDEVIRLPSKAGLTIYRVPISFVLGLG